MEIDLEKLKELAERATPGPWFNPGRQLIVSKIDTSEPIICDCIGQNKNDIAYIAAASPDVILAIIADYQDKKDALYGLFLFVNKLRDTLSLPEDAELHEVINTAIERIERQDKSYANA